MAVTMRGSQAAEPAMGVGRRCRAAQGHRCPPPGPPERAAGRRLPAGPPRARSRERCSRPVRARCPAAGSSAAAARPPARRLPRRRRRLRAPREDGLEGRPQLSRAVPVHRPSWSSASARLTADAVQSPRRSVASVSAAAGSSSASATIANAQDGRHRSGSPRLCSTLLATPRAAGAPPSPVSRGWRTRREGPRPGHRATGGPPGDHPGLRGPPGTCSNDAGCPPARRATRRC